MVLRIPKANTCFKCGLLILMAKVFLSSSDLIPIPNTVDTALSILGVFFLFISAVSKGYKPATYIVFVALFALGAYTSFLMGNFSVMLSLALCVAAYRQDKTEVIRFLYSYELGFLLVHTALAVVTSLMGRQNYIYMSGEVKYTLGFGHPNTFSLLLVNVMMMWSWMNYDKLTLKVFLLQLCVVAVDIYLTGTRTALVVMFIFIVLFYYVRKKPHRLSRAAKYMMPIIAAVQLLVNHLYLRQFPLIRMFDMLLSNRLKLGAFWYNRRGITIFGQNLQNDFATWTEQWKLSGEIPIDNLYNHLMMNCGVIWLVILSICLYRASRQKNTRDNVFIILWILYGIVEIHGINPILMFMLFLITSGNNTTRKVNG